MAKSDRPIPSKAAFDNAFGRWAMILDENTEADPIGVQVSLMAIFATFIGRTPAIKSKGRRMNLSFWPNLIGYASVGHKGTATDLALDVAKRAVPAFVAENVMRVPDSGLGMLMELEKRTDRATGGSAPTLIIEPEMGTKLIPVLQKDGRLSAALTTLWDGVNLTYSTGTAQIEIVNPHCSIIGHVQPDLLEGSKKGQAAKAGVWTRFFGVWVSQSKELDWFDDNPDIEYAITECGHLFQEAALKAAQTGYVSVPQQTRARVAAHHRPKIMALLNSAKQVRTYCERLPAYMLRIATLNALADGRSYVSIRDFDSALALCEYSVESMIHMLGRTGTEENKTTLAMRIEREAKENGPIKYTDLKAACGGHNQRPAFIAAFRELQNVVNVYTLPREGLGKIPMWIDVASKALPTGAELYPLDEQADAAGSSGTTPPPKGPTKSPKPPQADEEPEIVVEVKVMRHEPETPQEPLKAIAAPHSPRNGSRPSAGTTEPPRPTRAEHEPQRGDTKVVPKKTPVDPTSWF